MTIVATGHDAGGATVLLHFICAHFSRASWFIVCEKSSPFAQVASSLGLDTVQSVAMHGMDALFYSTSWQLKPELQWVEQATAAKVPSFAFLDHWSNYAQRFIYGNVQHLPSYCVVSDAKAAVLADEAALPEAILSSNYYLLNEQKSLLKIQKERQPKKSRRLLFFSEPTKEVAKKQYGDERYWGFTQEELLADIIENFSLFGCDALDIRLHPSETSHAYGAILERTGIVARVVPSSEIPLAAHIAQSSFCIGLDTMALLSAALLKVPLISYLPSSQTHERPFLLPLPASHQLRSLGEFSALHRKSVVFEIEQHASAWQRICEKIEAFA